VCVSCTVAFKPLGFYSTFQHRPVNQSRVSKNIRRNLPSAVLLSIQALCVCVCVCVCVCDTDCIKAASQYQSGQHHSVCLFMKKDNQVW